VPGERGADPPGEEGFPGDKDDLTFTDVARTLSMKPDIVPLSVCALPSACTDLHDRWKNSSEITFPG